MDLQTGVAFDPDCNPLVPACQDSGNKFLSTRLTPLITSEAVITNLNFHLSAWKRLVLSVNPT